MIGIYKVENLINKQIYIGQSLDIESRIKEHKLRPFRGDKTTNKEWDKKLYKAIREDGLSNFSFTILEECSIEELDLREQYYIELYKCYLEGYNLTRGGGSGSRSEGEDHPNHKLTEEEVYYIRECYKQHMDKNDVYKEFANKINFTGFHKVWTNSTWKNINQEVYTEENKQFYLDKRNSHKGSTNGRALLSEEDVYNIRLRKKNLETIKTVYQDYVKTGITFSSFKNVWYGRNWKNIIV